MYNSRLWLVLFFLSVASLSQRWTHHWFCTSLQLHTQYCIVLLWQNTNNLWFLHVQCLDDDCSGCVCGSGSNAITSTVSGIMLRKSHQIKYIEAVSFLKSSQRVLRRWAVRTGWKIKTLTALGWHPLSLMKQCLLLTLLKWVNSRQKLSPLPVWEIMVHVNLTNTS